jgi:hypothetical protein
MFKTLLSTTKFIWILIEQREKRLLLCEIAQEMSITHGILAKCSMGNLCEIIKEIEKKYSRKNVARVFIIYSAPFFGLKLTILSVTI